MDYFDKPENVHQYIQMVEGYDGRDLIAILKTHLPAKSTVLEIGMGPGKDLDLLAQTYTVTGSDYSELFLDFYRTQNPSADLLKLDAVTLQTSRKFDCIYSNKVLHHLSTPDLRRSFARQKEMITNGGWLFHSFWYGDGEEEFDGLRFTYYTENALLDIIGDGFDVIVMDRYSEMEDSDSFYILLRKKD